MPTQPRDYIRRPWRASIHRLSRWKMLNGKWQMELRIARVVFHLPFTI
jgi:hypothetical protein